MALGIISVLILLSVLCVHGEIYLYGNASYLFMRVFEDILSPDGPGLRLTGIEGYLRGADPVDGCDSMVPADRDHLFVIIRRGNCTFETKVRNAQEANYSAVIVHNVGSNALIAMPYTNNSGILVPAVFVSEESGLVLLYNSRLPGTFVTIDETFHINTDVLFAFSIFVFAAFFCMVGSMCFRYVRNRRRRQRYLLPASVLNSIPKQKYHKDLPFETCVICQENFNQGDIIRILLCSHAYHAKCIDVWLTQYKRVCAVCKRRVLIPGENPASLDSDSENEDPDDRTPLIRPESLLGANARGGGTTIEALRERLGHLMSPALLEALDHGQAASSSGGPVNILVIHSVNSGPDEFEEDSTSNSSAPTGDLDNHSAGISHRTDQSSNQSLIDIDSADLSAVSTQSSNQGDTSTQSSDQGVTITNPHRSVLGKFWPWNRS